MKTVLMMITILALVLSGCVTTGSSGASDGKSAVLDKHGLPNQKYLVGSAIEVDFRTFDEKGHIYLVEENSKTVIKIEEIGENAYYYFRAGDYDEIDSEEAMILKGRGVDPDNMNFAVYFIPVRELFSSKPKQVAFDENGLPTEEYYIGGGFTFNFTPDRDGMIYLVEKNSSTLILTQSLKANENLTEHVDVSDDRLIKSFQALGIDTDNMQFGLYFVPSTAAE